MLKRKRVSQRGRPRKRSKRTGRFLKVRRRVAGRRNAFMQARRKVYSGYLTPGASLNTAVGNFWQFQTVSLNNGLFQYNATPTRLTGLTNVSEYAALYDQYRLRAVKFEFLPKMGAIVQTQVVGATPATTSAFQPPRVCIIKDPMSTITPSGTYSSGTLNTLLENGGKIYRADRKFSVYLRPKIVEQYGTGATRYVSPMWTSTDAAGLAMEHRGFHMFLFRNNFDTSSADFAFDVFTTYYLQFKNPK